MTAKIITTQEVTLTFYDPSDILPENGERILFKSRAGTLSLGIFKIKNKKPYFIIYNHEIPPSEIRCWAHLPELN